MYCSIQKDNYDNEETKAIRQKNAVSTYPEDWVSCVEKDVKVGDIVFVEYLSDSQKYLHEHTPECGIVQEIEFEECISYNGQIKKELSIKIQNHNGDFVSLNKGHLSIYSKGYCMFIQKYELNHPATPLYENNDYCSDGVEFEEDYDY